MNINNIWYHTHPIRFLLAPLSWLFCLLVWVRRKIYCLGFTYQVPIPVIIVGNITVGGTGKTPLVIWLGQFLKKHGFKPGIVSRGYGGKAKKWPISVFSDSNPYLVGDEPVLLARHSGCPVAIAPRRIIAVESLLDQCDVIICDDGLQHYALHRDIEIVVIDARRRYGNGLCLPAGPLREPVSRLDSVDFVISNGHTMQFEFSDLRQVADNTVSQALSALQGKTVHAIAGIGHPARFFSYLREQGLILHCHEFPDHYYYTASDIQFNDALPIIMTEKDAVKCQTFATTQHWYLPITAQLPAQFGDSLLQTIKNITK
ncbi:MAG: tetraacyldisaccharide 4'-kinase [Thiomargarita sp.]|nr:tetraacyldisaccharide 4'-kinase [Thiomargarita sp.]